MALVLIVGDMLVPQRAPSIPPQFKTLLAPNKINHVLCLGNMGSQEQYDWLKTLSIDYHCVKGDFDFEENIPERECVQVGNFRIGMIHGHQVIPSGDINSLSAIQRELGCDILLYGHTHELKVKAKDNILYVNPGSISGAFSPAIKETQPSFIIMAIQGDIVDFYLYILNKETGELDIKKLEYMGGQLNEIEN